ncbi:MAG: hypothetical protein AB7N53_13860 [Candidatus Binatia bacterium]
MSTVKNALAFLVLTTPDEWRAPAASKRRPGSRAAVSCSAAQFTAG